MEYIEFKYGFVYKGQPYGWYKKQLYRLPFENNKRWYSLKLIEPKIANGLTCYNCSRTKLTINRLKTLTEEINIKINQITKGDCPF